MSRLAKSSLIVAFFFGIDKVVGFVRALIVNNTFDADTLDMFHAANNFPDLLSVLISGGALGVALIPVLSEQLEKEGRFAAWDIFTRILNLAFIVTGVFALVLFFIAPWLIGTVVAPGFDAAKQITTVQVMRLDLIPIMIFSISGLVMAGLQANQHFLLPALAPGLFNIGQIFGAVFLSGSMGIYGLVWGVIIGAVLHLGIQIPGLIKYEYRWAPKIEIRNPKVVQVLKLLGPRIVTMGFIQMFFLVRDNLASGMDAGSVTALNNGWFLMQVPETLLGTAIAIAILPTLSEIFTGGNKDQFRDTLNGAVRAMMAFTIPAAVLMGVGIRPLVYAAYNFEPYVMELIVAATRAYLLGLVGHALLEIGSRSFYAQQNAIVPLIAAFFNAASYLGIAVWFSRMWGVPGIALANSLIFTTEAFILLYIHNRKYPGVLKISRTLLRTLAGSALAGVALYGLMQFATIERFGEIKAAIFAVGGMVVGLGIVLPFIWQELKLMLKLGNAVDQV